MLEDPDRHQLRGQRLVRRDQERVRRRRTVRRQRIGVVLALVLGIAVAVVLVAKPFATSGGSSAPSSSSAAATVTTGDTAKKQDKGERADTTTTPAAKTTTTPAKKAPSAAQVKLAKATAQGNKAIDHVLTYTPWVVRGSKKNREIALTFDDGPSAFTPRIMKILREEKVPATFFQIGSQIAGNKAIVRQQEREGFVLADHTESHANLPGLSESGQRDQIGTPVEWYEKFGLPKPRLFRPPYGAMNDTTVKVLKRKRMLAVLWSVDTEDWRRPGARKIVEGALAGADNGAIILMHDGGGDREQTIAALPSIIHGLRKRGYKLVTVPRLMAGDPPPKKLPRPGFISGG
jgi:peptidoglycan/xylan/chitin deacetylase (PgdA/CDA1 family)